MSRAAPLTPIIGIIAGEGRLPFLLAEGIRLSGRRVLLLALRHNASPHLVELADEVIWLDITQIGKAIRACRRYGASEILLAGRVKHVDIFSIRPWRLGWTSLRLWWGLKDKRADTLLTAIANVLAAKGISLGQYNHYLESHMAPPGLLTKVAPAQAAMKDVPLGVRLAKELGRLDVGQTVIMKNGSAVAIEAMEGTDGCLERAGAIAGAGCVVIKMAKPNQDMRFDVPVIGFNTIEKLAKIRAALLVIEAGKTLLVDADMIAMAERLGVPILALSAAEIDKMLASLTTL